jgi:hypothetical protein
MGTSINKPQSIFGNTSSNKSSTFSEDKPSRLLNSTSDLRESLLSRNLYNENEYPNLNNKNIKIADSIISSLTPFKSYSLENTVYGRLITDRTPLVDIGLIFLAKQFGYNFQSQLSSEVLPIVKVSNLFDGNKDTKLFTPKISLKITRSEKVSKFQDFLDNVTNLKIFKDNPFNKYSNNSDFIKNTGEGQLDILYSTLNKNLYKQYDNTLTTYAEKTNNSIEKKTTFLNKTSKKYFSFLNSEIFNPYNSYNFTEYSINVSNSSMISGFNMQNNNNYEYMPNINFIEFILGKTNTYVNISDLLSDNEWIDGITEFSSDNDSNKIIWGRDGIVDNVLNENEINRGIYDNPEISQKFIDEVLSKQNISSKFKVRSGLLEYTRNLINATDGKIIDNTRKAFKKGEKIVGFNGSPLWKANESEYNYRNNGKFGIRQHSIIDPYGLDYVKAIRFNGSKLYGGNPNSVTYKSVMPRIHPSIDNNVLNKKNLMFSIENLAVETREENGIGIIVNDEKISAIPITEVGLFGGRMMWFPPYNVSINETSSPKYDTTVMIGRNEPMYNYMYTERSATLNFTLLIDYPPNIKNYSKDINFNRKVSEFFAFGGNKYDALQYTLNSDEHIENINNQIKNIEGELNVAEEQILQPEAIRVSFPNNEPGVDNKYRIFDEMYSEMYYEIKKGCKSNDVTSFGLNENIYFITGLTYFSQSESVLDVDKLPSDFSQYDQTGNCRLNSMLKDIFLDEKNRELYKISIVGGASKLYTDEYNEDLGKRRAVATMFFVRSRIVALFGDSPENLGITISYGGNGSTGSRLAKPENATEEAISLKETKLERYAEITIKRNNKNKTKKEPKLSQSETDDKQKLINDLESKKNLSRNQKSNSLENNVYEERNIKSRALSGFQSIKSNHFVPVYHSQTPEDFHKRLTFLHQCTRQGGAKRYDSVVENGQLRAKNSVFGKQPICVFRFGDMFYSKVIIENLNIDYTDATLDLNPENFGVQYMMANVTLQLKILGGESMKGPIDALQNAVSFNYYANSTFTNAGLYFKPSEEANKQYGEGQ